MPSSAHLKDFKVQDFSGLSQEEIEKRLSLIGSVVIFIQEEQLEIQETQNKFDNLVDVRQSSYV